MTPLNMTRKEFHKYLNELATRYHLIYLDFTDNFNGDFNLFCWKCKERPDIVKHIIDTGRLVEMGTFSKN